MPKAIGLVLPGALALLVMMGLLWFSTARDRRELQAQARRLSDRLERLEAELADRRLADPDGPAEATPEPSRLPAIELAAVAAPLPAASDRPPVADAADGPDEAETAAARGTVAVGEVGQVIAPTNTPMPRPYQVRVYLGSQSLGLAWAVPSNLRRDPATGRVIYEPLIRLPESAREAFKEYVTNVVEIATAPGGPQVFEREVYIEHRPYGVGLPYPVAVPAHRGRPRPNHSPQVPPALPRPEAPPLVRPPPPGDPGIYVPPFNR